MHDAHELPIDANLLPVLSALLETASVSGAAARLGRTQPGVSHALARLRAQLADALLVRVGTKMVLTPRAAALREPLAAALEQLREHLTPQRGFDPATATRSFSLLATDYVALLVLPAVLPTLRREAPTIDLLLRAPVATVGTELAEGRCDLGFLVRIKSEAGLRRRRLFEDDFVCVVQRHHAWAKRAPDLEAYLGAAHLLVAPFGSAGGFVDDLLAERGLQRRVVLRLGHFGLVPQAIVGTDLVTTLPRRLAQTLLERAPLAIVPLPIDIRPFSVSLAWHDRVHDDPGVRWLRERIVDLASARLG